MEATVQDIKDLQELEALYSSQKLQNALSGATALLQFLINKQPQKQLLLNSHTSENCGDTSNDHYGKLKAPPYSKLGKNIFMEYPGSG